MEETEREDILRENRNAGNTISVIDKPVGDAGALSDNPEPIGEGQEMSPKIALKGLTEKELRIVAGRRIREARERAGLRQIDVQNKMREYGVVREHESWLQSYENGTYNFTIYTARAFGEILNTSAAYLLCVDDTLSYDETELEVLRNYKQAPDDTKIIVRKLLGVE